MRILVTGAAGFIGSHLSERLAALGHGVIGLDCLRDFYSSALKEKNVQTLLEKEIPVLRLDLSQDDLTQVVNDVDVIYHLAAQPGLAATATFESYSRDNFLATARLVEAATQNQRLQAFINIATSSVYGADASGCEETPPRPTSYYGVTKLAAEQLALAAQRERGFPACSFRLFSVYGPRERPDKLYPTLIHALLTGQPFPLYKGSEHHQRSYTYVDDIVMGLTSVLERIDVCRGEIFNLGTDVCSTTGEGIEIVEALVGKPANIHRLGRRAGDQNKTHAHIAKARRLLDYNPQTSLRQGLTKTVAWYQHSLQE